MEWKRRRPTSCPPKPRADWPRAPNTGLTSGGPNCVHPSFPGWPEPGAPATTTTDAGTRPVGSPSPRQAPTPAPLARKDCAYPGFLRSTYSGLLVSSRTPAAESTLAQDRFPLDFPPGWASAGHRAGKKMTGRRSSIHRTRPRPRHHSFHGRRVNRTRGSVMRGRSCLKSSTQVASRPTARYRSPHPAGSTSPPEIVARAPKTPGWIVSRTNRTEPSAIATFAPPGW